MLTAEQLEILRGQVTQARGWGVMIARAELAELLRVYEAVLAAPEAVAGTSGHACTVWTADKEAMGRVIDLCEAETVVRLVPLATAKGGE